MKALMLLVAVLAASIAVAALTLGNSVSGQMTSTGGCISSSGATC